MFAGNKYAFGGTHHPIHIIAYKATTLPFIACQKYVNEELDKMLVVDVIQSSQTPWASPVVIVKKSNNAYRFCVDYRKLYKVSISIEYSLPFVSATLDKLRDAQYLTTLIIKSAYWQIPVGKNRNLWQMELRYIFIASSLMYLPNRGWWLVVY